MKANVKLWTVLAGLGETRLGATQAPAASLVPGWGSYREGSVGSRGSFSPGAARRAPPGCGFVGKWVSVREGRQARQGCSGSLDLGTREALLDPGRALGTPRGAGWGLDVSRAEALMS